MSSPETIVLLSGPVAVGKTTLRQSLIDSHGFDYVRSSVYLKRVARQRKLGDDRAVLQNLGDDLDEATDFLWLLDDVAKPIISSSSGCQKWLVDAVRKERQIQHFRAAYGSAVLHVHLVASEDTLVRRYAGRHEATSYETAIQHENEVASRALISVANLVIDNTLMSAADAASRVIVAASKHGRA